MARSKTVVVIGDTHFPFHSRKCLELIVDCVGQLKPDLVIQVGDLYDQYAFSRFPRDVNVATPKRELRDARLGAEDMWARIHRRSPRSKLVQMLGNHDARLEARLEEKCPEALFLLDIAGLYDFGKRVETLPNYRQEFLFDGTLYMHGHRSGPIGSHARYNQRSTVCGHTHKGGVWMGRNRSGIIWELNAGWVGNVKTPAFNYRMQRLIRDDTPGWGLVQGGVPSFVPAHDA